MGKKIKVTQESPTGRNQKFQKPNGDIIGRGQFVREIESGQHSEYHIRNINNVKTPVSNPDGKSKNNLG